MEFLKDLLKVCKEAYEMYIKYKPSVDSFADYFREAGIWAALRRLFDKLFASPNFA